MTRQQWRIIKLFFLTAFIIAYVYTAQRYQIALISYITGWSLGTLVLLLMLLTVIRKLPFFSICNARFWSQCHIYIGLFAVAIFLYHVDNGWPKGIFNNVLLISFLISTLSGLFGIFVYRRVPKKLLRQGPYIPSQDMLFEYNRIKLEAEHALKEASLESDCQPIQKFYLKHLFNFFNAPSNTFRYIFGLPNNKEHFLQRELTSMLRYANESEQHCLTRLITLMNDKNSLDYIYAQKLLLKRWLVVHIPLAYVVCLLIVIHIILVSAFALTT
ncbi:MAG: hypothetical protein COB66_07635 [Coxiella sp. (in: Bacteria)]|nr:MAG: hypothetical protein COB66_07635 [Coxiella sp. (in: g-proteobacteria)]